jgi:hypothetical protein
MSPPPKGTLKKDSKAAIKNRKIVKGSRTSVSAAKPKKPSVKEAKAAAKKASKKAPAKEESDEEGDQEMSHTELDASAS